MGDFKLLLHQVRYTNKAFWRNPTRVFFTFLFPLIFLVIFTLIFGGNNTTRISPTQVIHTSTFYVPAIAVFSIISACFTNIAISVSIERDEGVLKRTRGTPLPAFVYLMARVVHAVLIAILSVALVIVFGILFYHVNFPSHTLLPFILTLIIGSACFCALGLAVTAIIPNADAGPAVVNGIILPLLFISNVFIPLTNAPKWLDTVSKIFPVRHFSDSMLTSFFPIAGQSPYKWTDLLIMCLYGIVGLLIAVRYFSWEPRK
jgi:ABC-2 type transport system permease protein